MAKWQEITVLIHRDAQEAAFEILMNYGASGVAVEDTALFLEAEREGWGDMVSQVTQETMVSMRCYFAEPKSGLELNELRDSLGKLSSFGLETGEIIVRAKMVDEEDWANSWKQYYHTEKRGRIVIQPTWEPYSPEPDEVVLRLDPGMAFGTGTHPSTAMCLDLIQSLDISGKEVWDIGTGSGILAIAARLLGAAPVLAVDIDQVAVDIAKKNAQENGVEIAIKQGSLGDLHGQADVMIANIIADVIIDILPQASATLISGKTFVASGIIAGKASEVEKTAIANKFAVVEQRTSGEWVAYLFQKQ